MNGKENRLQIRYCKVFATSCKIYFSCLSPCVVRFSEGYGVTMSQPCSIYLYLPVIDDFKGHDGADFDVAGIRVDGLAACLDRPIRILQSSTWCDRRSIVVSIPCNVRKTNMSTGPNVALDLDIFWC